MVFSHSGRRLFCARLRTVAGFAVVTLRHPDRLNRLLIVAGDQVPLGPVHRAKTLHDLRQADPVAFRCQPFAKRFWPGRQLCQISNPAPVQRLSQLLCPEGWCVKSDTYLAKLLNRKAEKRPRDSRSGNV